LVVKMARENEGWGYTLGLVRYHVLFVIDSKSRTVEIVGLGRDPCGLWMEQMARNLVDAVDGFLVGKRYLLMDRDPLYAGPFRAIVEEGGVKIVRLPARSTSAERYWSTWRTIMANGTIRAWGML
jgi:putative transposase